LALTFVQIHEANPICDATPAARYLAGSRCHLETAQLRLIYSDTPIVGVVFPKIVQPPNKDPRPHCKVTVCLLAKPICTLTPYQHHI
jgi:hypothetical protein